MTDIGSHSTQVADEVESTAVATRDGKHPATPVAGPYGHPFHPILVTVPIGAWVASFVFDILSRADIHPHETYTRGASALILIGIVGALVAAVFGLMDMFTIPQGSRAFKTALIHMALNLGVVVLFAVNWVLRRNHLKNANGIPLRFLVASAIILVILGVSGYLGGKLAYRYGIRVADETTQAEGRR